MARHTLIRDTTSDEERGGENGVHGDYTVDEKDKKLSMSAGIAPEEYFGIENQIQTIWRLNHYVNQALHANYPMKKWRGLYR